jgi:hypothetical protein
MLQGLVSRTARSSSTYHKVLPRHNHHHWHLGRVNNALLLLSRSAPLVPGSGHSYAPAVLSSRRHYAQQIPPGGGQGGGGGIPGFKFPMQQQYVKGDALKEFVRAPFRWHISLFFFSYFADASSLTPLFYFVRTCRAST